ncbi:MAG: alpha/beta fold hydrolase [Steroidobacteraceae bacterium]|nr:alpha/beta fold hydrolase [Steroidobacteraceae bacterium]
MKRPISEPLTITGPAGRLQALLDTPPSVADQHVAVICHPHPLHGGAMTNKVAHMLARSFNEAGARALRFNFRGVGASEGSYDEGRGETLDTIAVIDWACERWPGARLWLAGFSFGGAIAARAALQRPPERLVTVAPAVTRVAVERPPRCPWLIIQGDRDELVDLQDVQRWASGLDPQPQIRVLAGVDHFFHGRLNELREVVVEWLALPPHDHGAAR